MFSNKCKKCGTRFSKNANFCPVCGEEKKKSISLFFLKMVLLFIIVQILTTSVPYLLSNSILYYKYGMDFVIESIWAMAILIVMLLSGNSYVFTQKREKFLKSLALGVSFLGMSFLILPSSIASAHGASIWACVNLALYCLMIGVAEEFLCRGWVLNEFLERFGKTRKQVILSIVLSAFIFGGMHITNIWNTSQGIFETFLQIIQATASGALLGSIYYRTKNIWAVACLHGFYDFALMLGEVNVIKACATGEPTNAIVIYHMFTSLIIIAFYIISTMFLLRKSKINKILDSRYEQTVEDYLKENKFSKNLQVALIVVIIFFFLPIGNDIDGYDDYYICYSYDELEIGEFDEHYSNRLTYTMRHEVEDLITGEILHYEFEVFYDGKIGIENKMTGDIIYLNYENVYGYEVIDNIDNFIIVVYDYGEDSIIHYMKIEKEKLTNNFETLQEIKTSFLSYSLPTLNRMGYLTVEENGYKYPFVISGDGDYFMIDEEDNLYLLR